MNLLKNLLLPIAAAASMAAPAVAAQTHGSLPASGAPELHSGQAAEAFAWRRFASHYEAQCFANYVRRCGGCVFNIYFDGCGWVVTYA